MTDLEQIAANKANLLARSRLEAVLADEKRWQDALTGEALEMSMTICAALDHLLKPEVTEAMRVTGINRSYEDDPSVPDIYKSMIAELTREDA